jgi:hypothetical protein
VWGQGIGGTGPQVDMAIDTEGNPTFADDGGGGLAALRGTLRMAGEFTPSLVSLATSGVKLVSIQQIPGWIFGYTGFATAGSGTAVANPYYRDARIYVSGGTVSSIKAGVSLYGTAAPSMTALGQTSGVIDWPSGGWLSITQTSAPTVNVCVS